MGIVIDFKTRKPLPPPSPPPGSADIKEPGVLLFVRINPDGSTTAVWNQNLPPTGALIRKTIRSLYEVSNLNGWLEPMVRFYKDPEDGDAYSTDYNNVSAELLLYARRTLAELEEMLLQDGVEEGEANGQEDPDHSG